MKELYSSRRRPFAARRLWLGALAVIAFLAVTASVTRWGAALQVPATSPSQRAAVASEPPGAASAPVAIAPAALVDAPSDLADAAPARADVARAPDASRADDAGAPPARAADPPARPDPSYLPPRVEAYARDAVDRYIAAAGLEEQLTETQREALVTALGDMRASSRWLSRHGEATGVDEARRRQALLDADRVFRDMLGVHLGELVTALAPPGTVEDLGADPR